MASVILSDVIDIISGGTPKTSEAKYWSGGNIDWLSINDFNNGNRFVYNSEKKITELALKESNTKLLNKGDVIISARGTVGVLAQIGKPMCFNQSCFGLRGKKGLIDNDFLYYVLKNYIHNLKKKSQGSVFDTINIKSFDLMEIDIPNYASQCSIASVLSALDKKIELNNRINAELEAMTKTLYDYWFVQFDFPNEEGKPYKSSGGKMVYNTILKREIPEGWEDKKLLSVTTLIRRGISPKYTDKGGACVLNQKCIRDQRILFEEARRYANILSDNDERLLIINDIVINSTGVGTLGRVAFVKRLLEPKTTVDSHITIVRANPVNIYPEYLIWTLCRFQYLIESAANGSTGQVELNKSFLENFNLALPDIHIQAKFKNFVSPLINKIAVLEQESENLIQLRDFLLPMLMNGQVTIK
jgi:type I restriction enzyme, S subunit